jgi:TonB family protein
MAAASKTCDLLVGRLAAALSAALAIGCGGGSAAQPAAKSDDGKTYRHRTPVPADDDGDDGGLEVEGLRAHLEPEQIAEGVRPHQAALSACYRSQLRATRFLGGAVELTFVVGEGGTVSDVRLSKADLGSWAVERCLLEIARGIQFAAPKGRGAAEFSIPLDFDSGKGRLIWWDEARADTEVAKALPELETCAAEEGGAPSNVWITLYVGNRGAVKSVGFASPTSSISEAWAICAAEVMADWKLGDPRGQIAKAGFRYRPE